MGGLGVVLGGLCSLACGPEPSAPAGTGARGATLSDLAATGYGPWDEGIAVEEDARTPVRSDPGRIAPGWNLFTDQHNTVILRDRVGRETRRLVVPGRTQLEHAEPVPDGWLTVSVDQGWDLFDHGGRHLWSLDGQAHHDAAARKEGGFYVLVWEERDWNGWRVRFDRILAVDRAGRVERSVWSSFEAREELAHHHPPLPLDQARVPAPGEAHRARAKAYDYHHINTIEVLGGSNPDPRLAPGFLLLCARNASLVFVLNPESGEVTWSFGPGVLDFPHTPSMTPEGNLLVFDNGWHRGWSRVLEIDPVSGRELWSFAAEPATDFFTKPRGSAQRLPNGNTLLCEAERGHAFEVDPTGRVVWELLNPLEPSDTPSIDHRRRRFYRLTRYPGAGFP